MDGVERNSPIYRDRNGSQKQPKSCSLAEPSSLCHLRLRVCVPYMYALLLCSKDPFISPSLVVCVLQSSRPPAAPCAVCCCRVFAVVEQQAQREGAGIRGRGGEQQQQQKSDEFSWRCCNNEVAVSWWCWWREAAGLVGQSYKLHQQLSILSLCCCRCCNGGG